MAGCVVVAIAALLGSCRDGKPITAATWRTSVPDLGLDGLAVGLDAAGGELDADRGLGLEVELVAGEAREQVTLADTTVSDQDHCAAQRDGG